MTENHNIIPARHIHEECGVFGIYSSQSGIDAAEAAYYGLFSLQHRGQESAGIAVSRKGKIECHKEMGLVSGRFCDGLGACLGRCLPCWSGLQ